MNIMSRNFCDTCQCLVFNKRAVFARSLLKCFTINSLKSTLVRLYSTKQDVKYKNHYDVLKITPYATQSEIKSAYYKLSLQYHPDKNKSDYAKQKFQDISDAYEVLSNHEQRKIYDRHIIVHQQTVTNIKESRHRGQLYTGATKIYNFDAWTDAHYGKQFEKEYIRRSNYRNNEKINKKINPDTGKHSSLVEYFFFFIIIMFLIFTYPIHQDKPVQKKDRKI